MALSRHVADVEGSVRRMLQLDREPDWQAQNTLRERVGNLANAARGLAALVYAAAPSDLRAGWLGGLQRPAPIDRPLLAQTRDESLADARARLAVLQDQLASRGQLGDALRTAKGRLAELQDLITELHGAR